MFNIFSFSGIEMPFMEKEKVFCVLVCLNIVEQDCAAMSEFTKNVPTAMQIWTWHKTFKEKRMSVQCNMIGRDDQVGPGNIFAKPQEVHKKSKSENQDFSNDSLEYHKDTLANDTLQVATHSNLKDR